MRQITELEAELARKDEQLAERDARLAEQEVQLEAKNARNLELEQLVEKLTGQMAELAKKVEKLTEKLGQNSRNSHRPPSSDRPGRAGKSRTATKGKKGKAKRKRGGQPGHRGSNRRLLAEDEVDEFVDVFPEQCQNCWQPLPKVADPKAKRDQVIEVPPLRPHTTEYRRHEVICPCCGYKTRAPRDERIPSSSFGPRLMSLLVLLTGVYHVSRRGTVALVRDMFGVNISLGSVSAVEARVSEAIEPAVAEVRDQVQQAEVKHTDGTSWLQAGATMSLWVIATTAATLFKVVTSGSRAMLEPLFGPREGILVSDRAKALGFWAMERRQICWAHLLRKFVSFSERDGPAGQFGRDLLDYTCLLFQYWQDYKDGKLDRKMFRAWMEPVRVQVEALLDKAAKAEIDRLSGSCADILAHQAALWTFVDQHGVEPTNNHAEREIRAFVLWRKRSFGAQSTRGNLFAERVMTLAHTARKQGKDVLTFLTRCCEARQTNTTAPSLFDADNAATARG